MPSIRVGHLIRLITVGFIVGIQAIRYEPTRSWQDAPTGSQPLIPTIIALHPAQVPDVGRSIAPPRVVPSEHSTLSASYRLLGTVLSERPVALFEERATGKPHQRTIGELLGAAVIVEIGRGAVRAADGAEHVVLLLEPTGQPAGEYYPAVSAVPATGLGPPMQLRFQFHPEQHNFEGVVLEAIAPSHSVRRFGLQDGDRIVAVNAQPLQTPAQTLQVLKKAVRHRALRLDGIREEQAFAATIPLGAVSQ